MSRGARPIAAEVHRAAYNFGQIRRCPRFKRHPSAGGPNRPHRGRYPRRLRRSYERPGVALRQLEPLTELTVQTRNTSPRIVVSHEADIVIQGGTFFPTPTACARRGSSVGGNLLKIGWIGVGLRMEIVADGRRIVTTGVVRSIIRRDDTVPVRPH